MSNGVKQFFRMWGGAIGVIISALTLFLASSQSVINVVTAYTKEIHENTLEMKEMRKEFSQYKVDAMERRAKRDVHEKEQDDKIEAINIQLVKLTSKYHLSLMSPAKPVFDLNDIGIVSYK